MPFFVDYNECEAKRDLCDENARCANNAGSYKCFCLAGYVGDGFTCESEYGRLTRCLKIVGSENCGLGLACYYQQCIAIPDRLFIFCCVSGYSTFCCPYRNREKIEIYFSSGDGSCGGRKCHRNAKCAEIDGVKQCQCKEGFVGSGLICVGTSCIAINMYRTGGGCVKMD